MAEELDAPFGDATYGNEELARALDGLEKRALAHQKAPSLPLGMARALQGFARMQVRVASREMAQASERKQNVLIAMTTPHFPAELYIEKVRANYQYRRAARELEGAKRRSGMAFRVVERAVRKQEGGSRPAQVAAMVAATRASLRRDERLAAAPPPPVVVRSASSGHAGGVRSTRSVGW